MNKGVKGMRVSPNIFPGIADRVFKARQKILDRDITHDRTRAKISVAFWIDESLQNFFKVFVGDGND